MKTDLCTYLSAAHGVTLICVPETSIERELLRGFGRFGKVYFRDNELRIEYRFEEQVDKAVK